MSPVTGSVPVRNLLIDVDGLVFMQTKNVGIFSLKDRVVVESPTVTDVEFLGYGVAVFRVDYAAYAAVGQCGLRPGQASLEALDIGRE